MLTTNKGRIIDLLTIHLLDDYSLLVLTSGGAVDKVSDWIDFYTIMEDVHIENMAGQTFHIRIVEGNDIADRNDFFRFYEDELVGSRPIFLKRNVGPKSFTEIIGKKASLLQVKNNLRETQKLDELSLSDYERYRVEMGEPSFGHELTEDFNPLEAGLIDYISFNKGCYIGQEVVARLNTYDKVQRKLVCLAWDGVLEGNQIGFQGKSVGVVTSSLAGVGLGYVRNEYAEEGRIVECDDKFLTVTNVLAK